MLFIIDKISALRSFINALSWRKISQLAVLLLLVGSAYVLFELRNSIYGLFNGTKISNTPYHFEISKQSADHIDSIVKKSDLIVGIQITIVDFQRNSRSIVYTNTDVSELNYIYSMYFEQNGVTLPLFNSDTVNNERLVSLINGDYICKPYNETILYRLTPDSAKYIEVTCSTGIPPFYGKFSGTVTILLKREPTPEEIDQIRGLSKDISNMLYERDFK